MKQQRVNCADASYAQLKKIAENCGFDVVETRNKHAKVRTKEGKFITTIPRHNLVIKPTAIEIVKRFNEFEGNVEIS